MKRVAIINFTGLRGNWGCQATSFELVKFVAGCFPDDEALNFTLVPLLPTSSVDRRYDEQIDRVYNAFTEVANGTDRSASCLAFLTEACVSRYGFWADIVRNADLVVFQAEGSMGLGSDFARGPRLMLLPFVAKHAWQRQVVSLNQSFYSQDERVIQNAAETFSTLNFAGFREGASVALARASSVANAAFVPDLAFLSHASGTKDLTHMDRGEGFFAISGSALKDPGRYRHILDQAESIRDETGLKPLVAVSRDVGMQMMAMLRWRPGSYSMVSRSATYTNVAAILKKCRFLVSGRYHMSIIAAAVGTPTIMLRGNSFKNDGLASLLAANRPVHDFGESEAINRETRFVLAEEAAERAALSRQVERIRASLAAAQRHLSEMIAGGAPAPYLDELPIYPYSDDVRRKYREFGSGRTRKKSRYWILPGAQLGRQARTEQILRPLLEGLAGDPQATTGALARMARGDPRIRDALAGQRHLYDGLPPV